MKESIYNQIINMLPSLSLRNKIAELGYTVPEIDLLRIVYMYAPDFEAQIEYFRLLQEECLSADVGTIAGLMRQHLEKAFADFARVGANDVYELRVKDEPDAYEEKYLCATLEDALKAIPRYYELYSGIAAESERSRYRIVKRHIFNASETFGEDALGAAEYRAGPLLYRVDDYGEIACVEDDLMCEDCKKICLGTVKSVCINMPKHIEDGELIAFSNYDGKQLVGYNIVWSGESFIADYYVIPLYEDGCTCEGWDIINMHYHIPTGVAERADFSLLNEKQRETYRKIEAFIRENHP